MNEEIKNDEQIVRNNFNISQNVNNEQPVTRQENNSLNRKAFKKKTGIIGIIAGGIGFILTLVYIIFSAYIFNNDLFYKNNNYSRNLDKLFPNGAYLKFNGYQYVPNYDIEKSLNDPHIAYVKYKELGQKRYNYDSDFIVICS